MNKRTLTHLILPLIFVPLFFISIGAIIGYFFIPNAEEKPVYRPSYFNIEHCIKRGGVFIAYQDYKYREMCNVPK